MMEKKIYTHLTLVELDAVAELGGALGDELHVVVRLELDGLVVGLLRGVVVGYRVTAVVRHVLVGALTEQLQEVDLDAVRLVGELQGRNTWLFSQGLGLWGLG